MNLEFDTPQFIITILSSGAIAALVSGIWHHKSEKEKRIFNTKFKIYSEIISHIKTGYSSILTFKEGKVPIVRFEKVSAKCMLVATNEINKKLKKFNKQIDDIVEEMKKLRKVMTTYKKFKENIQSGSLGKEFTKARLLMLEIEDLMREDLGFNK